MKMIANERASLPLEWKYQKGLVGYLEATEWMSYRVKAIQNGKAGPCGWLLEHPSLFTIGTSGSESDILNSNPYPVFPSGRGGQVTYHGPGQRVLYLMLDLKEYYQDIKRYVFELEEWIIQTLLHFGVKGERREGRVGIWVNKGGEEYKIAALGVRVQKWVTSHGLALNVSPDLMAYQHIIPCGISDFGVTSLKDLGVHVSMEEVDTVLQNTFPF